MQPHPSDDFDHAIQGFGGTFVQGGRLVVYVKEKQHFPGARALAAQVLRKRGRRAMDVEVRQGRFDFAELKRWQRDFQEARGSDLDVVGWAIDERTNGLLVEVETEGGRAAALAQAARIGMPAGMLTVRVRSTRLFATLNDPMRPLRGGTQILTTYNLRGGGSATSYCTYGVNTTLNGAGRYLVTASHCTQDTGGYGLGGVNVGGVVPTTYQGKYATSTYRVGTEYRDPAFTSTLAGCPTGATCRKSDAALIQITTSDNWELGGIAQTVPGYPTTGLVGDTTILSGAPSFQLAGTIDVIVGDSTEKMGRVTGWTQGQVGSACYNYEFRYTYGRNVILCSVGVFGGSREGDSGAPVFLYYGSEYFLQGILFAGSTSGDQYFFARWSDVNSELGPGLRPYP